MRIQILSLAAVAAVAACAPAASTTADPSAPRTQTFRADGIGGSLKVNNVTDASNTPLTVSAEDGYRMMPLVYDSLSIPKTWLDPKQFLISSQGFKIRARLGRTPLSKFIDCGQTQIGPNADTYDVFMTVTSRLIPNKEGGSSLTTTVDAASRPLTFNQDYQRCTSKGELEKRIAAVAQTFITK
jgi:hypothetical protein